MLHHTLCVLVACSAPLSPYNFACNALSLLASAMSIFWEPMRRGFEKDKGSPSTTLITSTARRRTHWQIWSSRLVQTHGATVDRLFRDQKDGANVPAPVRSLRYFVWFTDAAIKGTHFPALGGYAHGLEWVFPLTTRMLLLLPIQVPEFLALLAQVIIMGSLLPDPAHPATYEVLVGTDSVTSAWKLQTQHGSSQVMSIVLDIFLDRPEFQRLRRVIRLGHVYGEGNPLADNISRGDMQLFTTPATSLGSNQRDWKFQLSFTSSLNTSATKQRCWQISHHECFTEMCTLSGVCPGGLASSAAAASARAGHWCACTPAPCRALRGCQDDTGRSRSQVPAE